VRDQVKVFVKLVSETFDVPEPIVEIGSLQVPGQESSANLRPLFYRKKYIGCDLRLGQGVDRIENAETLSFSDATVGTIIMVDTLEHVQRPYKALDEAYRVLREDGILVISSSMDFPVHLYPSDYWRFTPQCFRLLTERFQARILGTIGYPLNPHTVFGLAFKTSPTDPYRKFSSLKQRMHAELDRARLWTWKLRLLSRITGATPLRNIPEFRTFSEIGTLRIELQCS
jgi:SAM-dependent methyltransferase